jgi:transcriptional regulator with XRE-family HTH domain
VTTPSEEQVGARIRNLRKQLGLTQVYCAGRAGVTQATWSSWEHGAEIGHVRLSQIADILGVTLIALLAPVDEPKAAEG